jgi:hypothetical protein
LTTSALTTAALAATSTLTATAALAALTSLSTLPTLTALTTHFAKGFAQFDWAVIVAPPINLFKGIYYIARRSLASCVRNDLLPVGWIVKTAQVLLDFGHRSHVATRLPATSTRLATSTGLAAT